MFVAAVLAFSAAAMQGVAVVAASAAAFELSAAAVGTVE